MGSKMKFALFGRCIDRCESFIERRFAVALLFSEAFSFEPHGVSRSIGSPVAVDQLGVILWQQHHVGGFRVDFAFTHAKGNERLIIELDGREFHSITPDQVERDKLRDRTNLAAGWVTVRFTGREINRDAMRCAQEVHGLFATTVAAINRPGVAKTAIVIPERVYTDEEWEAELSIAREAQRLAMIRKGIAQ